MLLTSMADVYCLLKVRNVCVRLHAANMLPQDLKGHSNILIASKSVLLCALNMEMLAAIALQLLIIQCNNQQQ